MFSTIRNRLRLHSLRARLTFWYLLTLGGSLLLFAVFVLLVRADTLHRELDAALVVRLHGLGADLRAELFALDVAGELAASDRARESGVMVRDAGGALVFRSPAFPATGWAAESGLARAARNRVGMTDVTARDGTAIRVASMPIERPGAAPLLLQLSAGTSDVRTTLARLAAAMFLVIGIVLAAATYGSGMTARRALKPVDEIVGRARHIQAVTPRDRLDVHPGSVELDRLVATLNGMLDRIEASTCAARRFAADASHELQTPLAAMRGIVETAVRRGRDVGEYQAMARELLAEIDRCSGLVRDLRLLAMAEAGQVVTIVERVDLAAVAGECVEIARAVAEDKAIRVDVRVRTRPVVLGSALHLRRVLLNLADNAVRYSPRGSVIDVGVGSDDGQASVSVRDHGCGIDEADLPHIFEPFYRADPARARETGGTGLGLAIADQIARAHGGAISVTSRPGEGSTFTLRLPLAPSLSWRSQPVLT